MSDYRGWKVLLVDDDEASRDAMSEWLERRGMHPIAVGSGKEAIEHMHDGVAVIVTDLRMPGTSGLDLLRIAKEKVPHAAVILISGHGTIDTAVTALKEGAFDFLAKPLKLDELTHRIERALENRLMTVEIAELHAKLNELQGLHNIVGNSDPMRDLFEKIRLVSKTKSTVLIIGEPGTGKELVARAIHKSSSRGENPFVPINCAAIPETLVEGELFGHESGVFTGAEKREGLFRAADSGTLFLDEIGELPLGSQSKLLRAIESRKIMPLGTSKEIDVDVRLVAATNSDLEQDVADKRFRSDLYYRLRVIELRLPPLRERREDIPLLIRYFIDQIAQENDRPVRDISPDAVEVLTAYDWPGNVRELRNTLESALVLTVNEIIQVGDLPPHLKEKTVDQELIQVGMTMEEIEKEAIRRTLQQTEGHRTNAAEILGISVRNLQRKIKKFELE
jgi:DNA-binding NtrC family response regulator